MDIKKQLELITMPPTEEILTLRDLEFFLEHGVQLRHYIGFEISGFVHLGTGLVCGLKIAQLQKAKAKIKVFLADYHSWINDKLGGNLDVIRNVAKKYFAEAMKLSIKVMGGNPNATEFILASEFYEENPEYWAIVLDVAKNVTLSRVRRAITIMGRKAGEKIDFAKLIYPCMQVADIFALNVNLPHGGMDQRKAHVIAREIAKKLKKKQLKARIDFEEQIIKPIALHHSLLPGLKMSMALYHRIIDAEKKGEKDKIRDLLIDAKMSKSIPETCIFIHDTEEEIKRKIKAAFCPPREIKWNPIIRIAELIIFPSDGKLLVERPQKYGGSIEYASFDALKKDFIEGKLHPLDLKNAVAEWLIKKLKPVRDYFSGPGKSAIEELQQLRITR